MSIITSALQYFNVGQIKWSVLAVAENVVTVASGAAGASLSFFLILSLQA